MWGLNINKAFVQNSQHHFFFISNTFPVVCLHCKCKITHTQNGSLIETEVSLLHIRCNHCVTGSVSQSDICFLFFLFFFQLTLYSM